jgi:SAM-dependent methyltransferase
LLKNLKHLQQLSGKVTSIMSNTGWTLEIKEMSWVENTVKEVDFIIKALDLKGNERILDLACGFGRHSLELAKRGYRVVGVDYTDVYIDDAKQSAVKMGVNLELIQADVLSLTYKNEFDVVLNMADGAIGYFSTEEQNLKLFNVIANSLVSGGKHLMGICSGSYYKKHCPWRTWEAGEKSISLADFHWNDKTSRMKYNSHILVFGENLKKINNKFPVANENEGIRLYTIDELKSIFNDRNLEIFAAYGTYDVTVPVSDENNPMIIVCSVKKY